MPMILAKMSNSLLLKKGKDPLLCGSYRPIILLNVDFKLLLKLLAKSPEIILLSVMSLDQMGFIHSRHFFFFLNLRRVFNIIYSSHQHFLRL